MKALNYETPFLGLYQTLNLDLISDEKKSHSENNINNNSNKVNLFFFLKKTCLHI